MTDTPGERWLALCKRFRASLGLWLAALLPCLTAFLWQLGRQGGAWLALLVPPLIPLTLLPRETLLLWRCLPALMLNRCQALQVKAHALRPAERKTVHTLPVNTTLYRLKTDQGMFQLLCTPMEALRLRASLPGTIRLTVVPATGLILTWRAVETRPSGR